MSAKSVREADGKAILNYWLTRSPLIKASPLPTSGVHNPPPRLATLYFGAEDSVQGILDSAENTYPWLLAKDAKFVAKVSYLMQ